MAVEVAGTITVDGVVSEFRITSDAEFLYQQWGADVPVMGQRVDLMYRLATAVRGWDGDREEETPDASAS